ncbi:Conserved_hypothetical protein [Hexamita inflata]|uniref:Uncharacterized protein n=1 Tax=Hexamita inflata TaxID=28002 RepID=A0AA86PYN6_9EUKA|nr:Conserved hypothetical protein [Hexamita inflata]
MQSPVERLQTQNDDNGEKLYIQSLIQNIPINSLPHIYNIYPEYKQDICSVISKITFFGNIEGIEQIEQIDQSITKYKSIQEIDVCKLQEQNITNEMIIQIVSLFEQLEYITIPYAQDQQYFLTRVLKRENSEYNKLPIKRLQIVANTNQLDQNNGKIYTLLSYCKQLAQLVTQKIQFIDEVDDHIDQDYFSKQSSIKSLVTQIFTKIKNISTLSLNYFSNLSYLIIQTDKDLNDMVLNHDNITTIKVESLQGIKQCFQINCPKLKRIVLCQNDQNAIICNNIVTNQLLDFHQLVEAQLNIEQQCKFTTQQNNSITNLKLVYIQNQQNSPKKITQEIFEIFVIKFMNLQHLTIKQVPFQITDQHLLYLLLEKPKLLSLTCTCVKNAFSKKFKYQINIFGKKYKDLELNLKNLYLRDVYITDQLMHSLFILGANYQLETVWFEGLNLITDSSIFLLLTSTEIRVKTSYQRVQLKPFGSLFHCRNITQLCNDFYNIKSAVWEPTIQIDQKISDSVILTDSNQQDFSCYVHDGIDDERNYYKISKLSVLKCNNITTRIFYAIQFGSFQLKFLQTDLLLAKQNVLKIKQNRDIVIAMRYQGSGDFLINNQWDEYYWTEYSQIIQFQDIK